MLTVDEDTSHRLKKCYYFLLFLHPIEVLHINAGICYEFLCQDEQIN